MSSAVQQPQQYEQYEQYNPNQQQQQLQQQQQHYLAPQERPQQRTRSKSGFSIKSDKSDAPSFGSKPKYSFKEAKQSEKKSRFGKSTKVDPNKALAEAQPAAFAQWEPSTLPMIRGHSYKDSLGNVIADPDRTNPTRPRLERPLDTIRSFEAAIESSHKRKTQLMRAESADAISSMIGGGQSRRTSMYLGNGSEAPYAPSSRYSPNHTQSPSRHMSMTGGGNYSHYGGYNSGYPPPPSSAYGYGHRRPMGHRIQSAPFAPNRMSADYSLYQGQDRGYHESHDTVNTTGESNGSQSEPWGNSTDPSSENSSIDRVQGGVERVSLTADRLQAIKQMEPESQHPYGYGRGSSPIHNAAVRDTAIREEEDGRSVRGNNYFMPVQQGPRRSSPPVIPQQQAYPAASQRRPVEPQQQQHQHQHQQQQQQQYQQQQPPQQQFQAAPKAPNAGMNAAAAAWAASSRPMPQQVPQQQGAPGMMRGPSSAQPRQKNIIKFETNPSIATEYAAENAQKAIVKPSASTKRKSWFGRKK